MKKLLALLSLVLVLVIPLSLVSANQETVYNHRVYRGIASWYISGDPYGGTLITKSSTSNSDYCVNLLYCLTSGGDPVNMVSSNNLVFRPYTSTGVEAANSVNFYGTYCNGENRRYGSYINNRGGQWSTFKLKRSLNNSGSTASYIDISVRWNP